MSTTTNPPVSCDGDCLAEWTGTGWNILEDGCVQNGCGCETGTPGTVVGLYSLSCTPEGGTTTAEPTTTVTPTTTSSPTTTVTPTTTSSPTTTETPTTTSSPTTTETPTTTSSPTTTVTPTTTSSPTTTVTPTTTSSPTTTVTPTTTSSPTTTVTPTTTSSPTTTVTPTTTSSPTTTPAPTTTATPTTTPAPTTTEEPWTTTSTTTTTKPPTTPEATTTPAPTTTPEATTTETPTTTPEATTTPTPTTTPEATTTPAPTTQPPTTQPPTTQPPTTPPGGTTTCEPGSQACIAEPPEPAWIDLSGDFVPPEPFLWWPVLSGPAGCTTRPAFSPTFAPACIGDCPEIPLVPGCLDSLPYQVENYCDIEQTNTCLGLGDFFRGHRWTINGYSGRGSAVIGGEGGVWESGVIALTPNCEEDVGANPMVIRVSRPAQEIELSSGQNCHDVYGNTQGPVKLVLPTIIPVCVVRDGTTSAPCPV